MTDPVRLGEESESELESALLGAGAAYRSSPRARARTLAALGLAGSATMAAGAATAASLSPLAKLSWLKMVAAVSIVGTAAGVPATYYISRPGVKHPAVALLDAPRTAPRALPAEVAPPLGVAPPPPNVTSRPIAKRPTRRAERPSTAPSVTLTQELVALDAARAELADGNARGALSLLDTYGRAYRHGDLALEAEVLRIDALKRAGRADVAQEHAATFLRRHPNSVLASRVRAYTDN